MQNLYVILIILGVFWGIFFIITAIATAKMAKDFEIKDRFLAFIPFSQQYLQGKIADIINKNDNEWSCYKILYPILTVITILGYGFLLVAAFTFDVPVLSMDALNSTIAINAIIYMILFLIISLVCLIYLVVLYKCHYIIFNDYDSKHAVLYTFLSVFFNVHPLILYLIKDKKTCNFNEILISQANKIDDGIEVLSADDVEIITQPNIYNTNTKNKLDDVNSEDIANNLSFMIDNDNNNL